MFDCRDLSASTPTLQGEISAKLWLTTSNYTQSFVDCTRPEDLSMSVSCPQTKAV